MLETVLPKTTIILQLWQLVLVIITKNSVFRGHNATNRSQRYENRRDIKTRELVPQAD